MKKQLIIFSAITDILTIFADTEIGGQYEFDYDAIDNYISSFKCGAEYSDYCTKEEIYDRFTQDIYNGLPVWRFLKLPEWTMKMVEDSFKTDCDNEFEQLKKIYKCMTCKYFKVERLSLGLFWKECEYDKIQKSKFKRWHRLEQRQDDAFEMKTACDNYEVKNEETQ